MDFSVQVDDSGAGGNLAVLTLGGELDASSADRLLQAMDAVDPAASGLVLDVANVSFVDSSGLRVLLQASDRIPADGGGPSTTLRHQQRAVTRLLDLTGLLDHFGLVP